MSGRVGPNGLGTAEAETVGPDMSTCKAFSRLIEPKQSTRLSGRVGPSGLGTAKAVTVAPIGCVNIEQEKNYGRKVD